MARINLIQMGEKLLKLRNAVKKFQFNAAHEKSYIKRRKLEIKAGRALAKAAQMARIMLGETNGTKER